MTEHGTVKRTTTPVRLAYPAYGPVESALGFGLFYLVVDRVTPVLVAELSGEFPALVPDPFRTFTAMLLWLVLGITVLTAVLDQVRDNPRTFDTPGERREFLADNRPATGEYWRYAGLAGVGGAVAAVTWDSFRDVLPDLLVVVVSQDGAELAGTPLVDVLAFVSFFLGFAALSRGVDRLAVGALRDLLYRSARD